MKKFFLLILPAAAMLFPACSRKAPNPPVTRSNLILEILYALDRKDYDTALSRTKRLHTLDPSNSVLAELEQVLKCNVPVREASRLFNAGRQQEAFKLLDQAILSHGNVKQLVDARAEFTTLSLLDRNLSGIVDPVSSPDLKECTREVMRITDRNLEYANIRRFAETHSRQELPRVIKREKDLIVYCVSADMDQLCASYPARRQTYSVMKGDLTNFIREFVVQDNILNSTKRERY